MPLDRHHGCVDTGDLHCRVEHAIHDLRQVDRAAELSEEPIPACLALRSVERLGQILRELVHLEPHLVHRANELGVSRRRGVRRLLSSRKAKSAATRTAAATRITAVVATVAFPPQALIAR